MMEEEPGNLEGWYRSMVVSMTAPDVTTITYIHVKQQPDSIHCFYSKRSSDWFIVIPPLSRISYSTTKS
jgi:hypothetical protein